MSASVGTAGFGGILAARLVHPKPQATVRQLRVPGLGRIMFTRDSDGSDFATQQITIPLTPVVYFPI